MSYCDNFIAFILRWCPQRFFFLKLGGGGGGGGVGLSLRFIISPPTWPVLCFSVMSELNLDNPGFQSLGAPPSAPPLSGSSIDAHVNLATGG